MEGFIIVLVLAVIILASLLILAKFQSGQTEETIKELKRETKDKTSQILRLEKENKELSHSLQQQRETITNEERLKMKEAALAKKESLLLEEKEKMKHTILYEASLVTDNLKWYKHIIDFLNYDEEVSYRIANNYFISSSIYPKFIESLATARSESARKGNYEITVNELVEIKAQIKSADSGRTYLTTLQNCTCEDFQIRKLPCKHMLALAFSVNAFVREQSPEVVILQEIRDALEQQQAIKYKNSVFKTEFLEREKRLNQAWDSFKAEREAFDEEVKSRKAYLDVLEGTLKEKLQTFPYLADIIARYKVETLEIKIRDPITKKEMTSRLKSLEKQVAMLENQIAIYEYTFPILEELKTLDVHEIEQAVRNADDTGFNYQWLSADEYATLTSVEKQEKWLDRYFHARSRTAWEAGIKYERYIGYLCEKEGYSVKYIGALLKLEDMGRDLIVTKKNNVYIVQCKRFSENKEIHENHVFQLYGSIYHYKAENKDKNVCGVFVTSAKLSEVARACATDLALQVFENVAFKDYPCIKCNVSSNGEKIYHLPFDQQYDHTHIGKRPGECYVATVREAQELGFRHAMKHTFIQ